MNAAKNKRPHHFGAVPRRRLGCEGGAQEREGEQQLPPGPRPHRAPAMAQLLLWRSSCYGAAPLYSLLYADLAELRDIADRKLDDMPDPRAGSGMRAWIELARDFPLA